MKPQQSDGCELCERQVELHFHHLIPKKMHNKRPVKKRHDKEFLDHYGIWVCADCHKFIHKKIDHEALAYVYNTKEALLEHEELAKFIQWVRKQSRKVK